MLKRKATIKEKNFIGYAIKKRIEICTSCIAEAMCHLKKENSKKSNKNINAIKKIENDITFMTSALTAFKKGISLDGSTYTQLVRVMNEYYYKRIPVLLLLSILILILFFSIRLTDEFPFASFPIINPEPETKKIEMMQILGYDTQKVTKKHPYVQLKNIEGNSVYLKYSIYNKENELLYESLLVEPKTVCDRWNAYEALPKGKNKLEFRVEAYESDNLKKCSNVVVIPVKVIKS